MSVLKYCLTILHHTLNSAVILPSSTYTGYDELSLTILNGVRALWLHSEILFFLKNYNVELGNHPQKEGEAFSPQSLMNLLLFPEKYIKRKFIIFPRFHSCANLYVEIAEVRQFFESLCKYLYNAKRRGCEKSAQYVAHTLICAIFKPFDFYAGMHTI